MQLWIHEDLPVNAIWGLNSHDPYQSGAADPLSYGGRFRAFLSYFPVTSHLFSSYFSNISHFLTISKLFLSYFLKSSHFPTISGLFLSHFSLLNYSFTSRLFLIYFSTISQLLLGYFPVTPRRVKTVFNIKSSERADP